MKMISTIDYNKSAASLPASASLNEALPHFDLSQTVSVTFSQEMVKRLKASGLSEKVIAQHLKVSRYTVANILKGKVKACHPRTFNKLLTLYCANCIL